ncbi:hypothetical protein HII31_04396 [Pseudocercospora fuligena]|uniref:Uncharacterized protein n=1 Tax=Pseudocercospora fuligena TaxID=685502 RepID=A0A8H6RP49_9PEZI|nr:hypothetical protein HII31_04396 [Pseudocercospora fuligena]
MPFNVVDLVSSEDEIDVIRRPAPRKGRGHIIVVDSDDEDDLADSKSKPELRSAVRRAAKTTKHSLEKHVPLQVDETTEDEDDRDLCEGLTFMPDQDSSPMVDTPCSQPLVSARQNKIGRSKRT